MPYFPIRNTIQEEIDQVKAYNLHRHNDWYVPAWLINSFIDRCTLSDLCKLFGVPQTYMIKRLHELYYEVVNFVKE